MFREKSERKSRRRHLGVWDPTGGEAREGSGLPVEEGVEKIRILARDVDGGVREVRAEELEGAMAGAAVWIDLVRPRERAERILRDALKLPPLTVEDCLGPLRMPKMDVFTVDGARGGFVAGFAARFERAEMEVGLRAVEVDLVAGPGYLVTVRDGPVPEVGERLERRMADKDLTAQPGFALAYEAMDALIDGHLPALVEAATAAEELDEALDPSDERASVAALEALISLRRDLQAFRRLATAQQEILRRLGRAAPDLREYLSDAADNQREAVDMAEATRDYAEGAVEAYRIRRDERSELGIRRLTVFAAILGPLTLVSGIYGANFARIPGTESPLGFPIFVIGQALFVVAAVWFLYRRGLL
ncbi:MAG TPA: magnesium transporter CorA family protein [Rubrobacteraceae bacterium]|nr:magnesium transporter CorA family protein [Rubrobacteraceae bacterium]